MTPVEFKHISVEALKAKIENDPHLCLIDVREEEEWQAIHIPGAHLIPKDRIADEISAVVPDLNTPIYLHCRSGMRSCFAANVLVNLGYKDVYSVDGGIMEWASLGYPVNERP